MAVTYKDRHGKTLNLPKLTLDVSDRMDAIQACEDNRERYSMQYEFLKDALGEDYVNAEVDGNSVEDADLVMLNILYIAVVNAYALPVQQQQLENAKRQLSQVQPMLGAVDSVTAATKALNRSRQGFKAVR